jgi:hydroxyacylglutathione hydrolase
MFSIEPIAAFNDNYIWLLHDPDTRKAFVVDPGDAAPVLAALDERQLELAGVLITHHHFDHVGGLEQLQSRYDLVVYGPHNPAVAAITHRVAAGDRVEVLGQTFEVLAVPGHTLDHIAYFAGGPEPVVFCGDTLFAGGCGRVFEGTPAMMHQSLQVLAALPAATRVYCAHEYTLANLAFARAVEPDNAALTQRIAAARASRERDEPTVPSELGLELATNPFVRCGSLELHKSLKSQGKYHEGETAEQVFATVRAWKDNF